MGSWRAVIISRNGGLGQELHVAGSLACIVVNGDKPFTTTQMSTDFLQSPRGCDLYASAKVIKSKDKVSVADIQIIDEANTVYAVSRGSWAAIVARSIAELS